MRNRWVVLAIYAWIAGLSQLLWLNFAPILSLVEKRYAVSESAASLLLLVFPLTYCLLSVHAGSLIDRRGYRAAIGLGAIFMAAFSVLRIFPGFGVLLLAQTGISLGQPYVVNAITKLVADWFPAEHAALATGLGTVGLFIGMAIGMAATPPAIDALGFSGAMIFFAVLTCISAVAFLLLCPTRANATAGASAGISRGFWPKLKSRNLLLLLLVSFVGLGYFNGLTSWIEAILAPNGIGSAQAGVIGGTLIAGGISGSALVPALADRLSRRKPFLLATIVAAALTLVPLCRSSNYRALLAWGFLQGFFFLPAYALLLDMTSLEAGERWAGSATGVLMLAGNGGGVIAIFTLGAMKGDNPGFPSALWLLLALLAVAFAAATRVQETRSSKRASSV